MGALFDNGEYLLLTKIKIKLHHHWLWQNNKHFLTNQRH
jgi:hypothetical protein